MLRLISCLLVTASLASAGTNNATNNNNQKTPNATSNAKPGGKLCELAGKKWSDGIRYVSGRKGKLGSVFGECRDGKLQCYKENLLRDHQRKFAQKIPCDQKTVHQSQRELGIYLSEAQRHWPQAVVCYQFDYPFTDEQKGVFTKAMDEYHQKTSVKYVAIDQCATKYPDQSVCGGCKDRAVIVNERGDRDCFATLGYVPGGEMRLNFGMECFNGGGHAVAVHELGHLAGLTHEHTHPERQVVVLRGELTLSPDNYARDTSAATTQYSLGSVMHYPRTSGLCIPSDKSVKYCDITEGPDNGCTIPTAAHCDASQDNSFGLAEGLADSDIETLAKIYGGSTPAPSATSTPTPTTAPTPQPPTGTTEAPSTNGPSTGLPTGKPDGNEIRQVASKVPTAAPITDTPATTTPTGPNGGDKPTPAQSTGGNPPATSNGVDNPTPAQSTGGNPPAPSNGVDKPTPAPSGGDKPTPAPSTDGKPPVPSNGVDKPTPAPSGGDKPTPAPSTGGKPKASANDAVEPSHC